jgi:hypothetical protein
VNDTIVTKERPDEVSHTCYVMVYERQDVHDEQVRCQD